MEAKLEAKFINTGVCGTQRRIWAAELKYSRPGGKIRKNQNGGGAGAGRTKRLKCFFPPPSGVFHLHQGDIITVKIPRANAKLSLSPHGTFLGFVKL